MEMPAAMPSIAIRRSDTGCFPDQGIAVIARIFITLAMTLVVARTVQASPGEAIDSRHWNDPQQPFRIYGNTWYVGPHGLSSILVDTGAGLALFDGDLPSSAPLIEAHIRALGFPLHEVKWILNSHDHSDHAGGIAQLQRDTGASVLASAAGAWAMARGGDDPSDPQYGILDTYPPVAGVRVVHDGQVLHLGDVDITAHATPGHTRGSLSWTWTSCADGRCLHMVYADSLSAISAPGYRFSDHPERVADFRRAIATVAALPCDVLLTPHPDGSDFWLRVSKRRSDDDVSPLRDPGACRAYAAAATARLDARLAQERRPSH